MLILWKRTHRSGLWQSAVGTSAIILAISLLSCGRGSSDSSTAKKAEPAQPVATTEPKALPTPISKSPGLAVGKKGAVTSAEAHATDVGLAVLKKGGNAVDAAIAVGFALGVTHPSAGNIGGGGFMVVRLPDGSSTTIDYREIAPGLATRDMYLDKSGAATNESQLGPRAAGIPGVVAGLWLAHQKHGSMPWKDLVTPAVRLARDGWKLDSFHADDLSGVLPRIRAYRDELGEDKPVLRAALDATLATFRKSDGTVYKAGEVWKQPELAKTLEAIAEGGQGAFYKGDIAKRMAKEMTAMGGLWTAKDLAGYRAVVRKPVQFSYRGHEIITMPPPSAGGVVLRQVLAAADTLNLEKLEWDSIQRTHLYVEALRRTYADRNQLIGDPDFIKIPMDTLLNVEYMAKRMADVDPKQATLSSKVGAGVPRKESEQTTHFSVVDAQGMAVANTYTLNGYFGAKVQIPNTGVTLNNEMDDFTAKVGTPNMFGLIQGPQNSIEPGKRMLSSMTPTILVKDGKVRAVLGSPGGPTISTTVAQILLQLVDHGRSLSEAVAAPRVHHQWLPDQILHEEGLSSKLQSELAAMGHKLRARRAIGHANCIEVTPSGEIHAVADVVRDGGKAAAY